jgi:Ni/Fe-hydrogenase subunit HybB-like protein
MVQTATFQLKRGTGLAQTEAELLDNPVAGSPTLILRSPDFHSITEVVAAPVEGPAPIGWWLFFIPSVALLGLLGVAVSWLFWEGIGIWGLNVPVGWAWDITNFVFWVGIGHAGTLISAILFLFRQKWRTSINRAAEAMTIFAVMCALLFPGIHVGRVWVAYWMFPLPNQMDMWPNFRSPLVWDVFAVSVYGTVSVLFWYVGLIPDLATMRDRAKTRARKLAYGFFALGWRGSVRQWRHYESAYLLLAALATPLVLSVHSVVSMDFAVSLLPGWHTTIFPPYFVAGAIFSGFAMVLTLMVICRKAFGLEHIITLRHFDLMAKIMLVTGTMVGYAYATEFFTAWYSGNPYEFYAFLNRAAGPYAWAYWIMVSCNVISPQLFWFKKARTSIPILFTLSIVINIGMWFERFVIIVTSLHRDFLPSAWGYFTPTMWDVASLLGSFGLFFTLFCLFVRFLPMVATAEVKTVLPQADPHWQPGPERERADQPPLEPGRSAGALAKADAPDRVHGAKAGETSDHRAAPQPGGAPEPAPRRSLRMLVDALRGMPLLSHQLPKGPHYGILAEFATPADLSHACERVRDAGFTRWDAHTPFPVHGLEGAWGSDARRCPGSSSAWD